MFYILVQCIAMYFNSILLKVYFVSMTTGYQPEDQLFDLDMFRSAVFQRPFQYLLRLDTGRQLQDVNPQQVEGTEQDCLRVLLRFGFQNCHFGRCSMGFTIKILFKGNMIYDFKMNNTLSKMAILNFYVLLSIHSSTAHYFAHEVSIISKVKLLS